MHEYSVASELISALLPKVEEIDGQITGVVLRKGELRILSDTSLRNAFELLAEDTPLRGAELIVETVPVSVTCANCGYQGSVDHVRDEGFHFAVPILSCPKCEQDVTVVTGRELLVDRLVVTQEDEPPG